MYCPETTVAFRGRAHRQKVLQRAEQSTPEDRASGQSTLAGPEGAPEMGLHGPLAALPPAGKGLRRQHQAPDSARVLHQAQHQEPSRRIPLPTGPESFRAAPDDILAVLGTLDPRKKAVSLFRRVFVSYVDEEHTHMDLSGLRCEVGLPEVPWVGYHCLWRHQHEF